MDTHTLVIDVSSRTIQRCFQLLSYSVFARLQLRFPYQALDVNVAFHRWSWSKRTLGTGCQTTVSVTSEYYILRKSYPRPSIWMNSSKCSQLSTKTWGIIYARSHFSLHVRRSTCRVSGCMSIPSKHETFFIFYFLCSMNGAAKRIFI